MHKEKSRVTAALFFYQKYDLFFTHNIYVSIHSVIAKGEQVQNRTCKHTMGRLNDTRLFGYMVDKAQIALDNETGKSIRAMFHLAVIRSTRFSGENLHMTDKIMYDWPIILSTDPEMIAKIEKLEKYDIVDIKGTFVTKKIIKNAYCKGENGCNACNKVDGNICYIMPIALAKRNREGDIYTEKQAMQEVIANREFSNNIHLIGNLCNPVNYFHDDSVQTSVFQVATDRKYVVTSDNSDIHADFPIIRSYGKQAKKDSICLQKGSTIVIDGYLHTRNFPRKTICSSCGNEFEWKDCTTEIIPFVEEYVAGYIDYETALKNEKQKAAEEGAAYAESIF